MLLKIQLILVSLLTVEAAGLDTNSPILIKLNTNQVIDALTSKQSVKYIEKLAKEFASKAAEHFIDEIRNKEQEINNEYNLEKVKKSQDRGDQRVLDETEALILMDEPPPDGDNLSGNANDSTITDNETEVKKKTIPVIGVTKINGRYFYRRYYMI